MAHSEDVFKDVPEVARIWVIPTDRVLSEEEQETVSSHLSRFFGRWNSHGRTVVARSTIEHNRFVLFKPEFES